MALRIPLMLLGAALWPGPAAAGLGIEAPASFLPGDAITITLTGDSQGATASVVRAVLTVDSGLGLVSGTPGVLHDSSATLYWEQTGVVGACGVDGLSSNQCIAVDAIGGLNGFEFPIDLLPSTLSTFTFDTTNATGDLFFQLDPDGPGFFGLPGTTAVVPLIPEPATGLLLALGLVALAGRGARA